MKTVDGITRWPHEFEVRYRTAGYWRGRHILDFIEPHGADRPNHPAILDGEVVISYSELLRRVDACSRRLLDTGLQPDDRLVVQLPNGWQFIVLTLACMRAGIVPVMALPAHREHELRYLVDHSEAVALASPAHLRGFDHQALAEKLRATTDTLKWVFVQDAADEPALIDGALSLEALCAEPAPGDEQREVPPPDASSVAVFLLSGGTTGLPKLIPRTHDDYVCNIVETSRYADLDENTVYLGTLPLGHNFVLACPGILGTLFAGGTVVPLASPQAEKAFDAIARHRVTHSAAVPAVAAAWLERAEAVGVADIASLRVLQVGGARLADELATRIVGLFPCTLQQVFGMAEGLINVTRLDDPTSVIVGTQGRPVCADDEILIIDEATGQEVPPNEPGVLLTRGPYTPRGYYDAYEVNERSFTPDGWYISGDIVRQTTDGNLIVEGRSKDMINRGGENISAEEVENLTYRLAAVRLAAAVAMPDEQLGERVCLFAVLHDGHQLGLEDVRQRFDQWGVAAFKRPDRLVHLPELPLTKVGKIDKKALREWLAQNPPQHSEQSSRP